jgi:hypothetical protein
MEPSGPVQDSNGIALPLPLPYKSMNALSGHCLPSHIAGFDVLAGRSVQFRTQLLDQLQGL